MKDSWRKKGLQGVWLGAVLFFLYAPIFILAVYSFTESTMIGTIRSFSFNNYITLFTTPELAKMILGTFLLAVIVAAVSTVLGSMGAIGAFYSKRRIRHGIEWANQIPVVNADVVTGFSVCILLIVFWGMDKDTYIPLVIGQTALCAPFVYLSVIPRLKQMDQNLYEAALDLGCTPAQALRCVVLPQLVPGILSGFVLSVTLSLDDYFITTYTKPTMFDTISTYVVNATKGAQTEIKTALWALSTVIFLVVVLAVILMNRPGVLRRVPKKGAVLFFCIMVPVLFSGCGRQTHDDVTVLRIGNWEEYIDEGDWDEEETIDLEDGERILGIHDMTRDFEKWYEKTYGEKVRVEYSTFGTNEELYNQMTLGDTFDLVCPSEYMIMKLMAEGRLRPFSEGFFDTDNPHNYYSRGVSPYIHSVFENLQIGEKTLDRYSAGYMWGTMGIVYNPAKVKEEDTKHWSMLINNCYAKQITMKDSVRDSYIVGMGILKEKELMESSLRQSPDYNKRLTEMMNDTSKKTVDQVEAILSRMRENSYSLETDSGKADMVTGKVVANMQWSGDGVYTMDQAEEDGVSLNFVVPEEASNLWFDGWCMIEEGVSESTKKQQAAEAFVNFVSRPDNVIRNMYYIGYTSVIAGGEDKRILEYADWCYGAEEDAEETVKYPLGYFFSGENADEDYMLTVEKSQADRQVFAQYPTEEVIRRSAVMKYFDQEENKRISQMWTNIRCFDLMWWR